MEAIILSVSLPIFILYADEFTENFNDIVNAFSIVFSIIAVDIQYSFHQLLLKVKGLPTDREFSNFEDHYDKHSDGFSFMPGGNNQKPSKKKFWEQGKKFLSKSGPTILTGTSLRYPDRMIKFNTQTLEYMVYDKATKLIRTYFIPYDEQLINGWIDIETAKKLALEYFKSRIK